MPKYRIVVEFETEREVPENVLQQLQYEMGVQTESLSDGSFDHLDGRNREDNVSVQSFTKEEDSNG